MASRLTLTLPPAFGGRTVAVDSKRFSIGRTPENDLVIEENSLSRRHALIEDVEGHYTLSDCGSANGTFVNGQQIFSPVELFDWDVLTFGGASDVLVRIERDPSVPDQETELVEEHPVSVGGSPQHELNATSREQHSLGVPLIAVAAALVIVLITGVVLVAFNVSKQSSTSITRKSQQVGTNTNDDLSSPGGDPTPTIENANTVNSQDLSSEENLKLQTIEALAAKVLTGISRDQNPVLTEKPLSEISAAVQRYHGKVSLQADIQSMRRALPQVTAIAKANNVRAPLAVYATLATIHDNGGEPTQVAARLCPSLSRLQGIFGDELANDSLLTVAALEEGPALQGRVTRLAGRVNDSPMTIRSIWYLHDHQVVSDKTFNFVMRFLAMGVISQDPQKFGLAAEPIVF